MGSEKGPWKQVYDATLKDGMSKATFNLMDDGWCKAEVYENSLTSAATKVVNRLEEARSCMLSVVHGAL